MRPGRGRTGRSLTSVLDGGAGDDRLRGGAGSDLTTGGAGVDAFVFGAVWTANDGSDAILDLEDGVGRIDLRASGLTFAELAIDASGQSAIVTSGAGRIEVVGFGGLGTAGTLTEGDVLFA